MVTKIGAWKIADPAKFEREVRRAMREADGRIPAAAIALGVTKRTLERWLADPKGTLRDVPRAPVGSRPE